MTKPFHILQALLFGLIFAPVEIFVFVLCFQAERLIDRFKEDVTFRKKVKIFVRIYPKYLRDKWNWWMTAKFAGASSIVFGALCVLGALMIAGIQAVYF